MPSAVERAYRAQLAHIQAQVVRAAEAAFGEEIDEAEIKASFARFVERIAPLIAAGQGAAQDLTGAFLEQLALEHGLDGWEAIAPDDELPGTTSHGESIERGLEGIAPMMLAGIAAGKTPAEALEHGRYLVSRFADNEVRAAADREQARQEAAREIVGWRGVVQPGSCDPCRANEGDHGLDEETYRHPNCGCERIPIFAAPVNA